MWMECCTVQTHYGPRYGFPYYNLKIPIERGSRIRHTVWRMDSSVGWDLVAVTNIQCVILTIFELEIWIQSHYMLNKRYRRKPPTLQLIIIHFHGRNMNVYKYLFRIIFIPLDNSIICFPLGTNISFCLFRQG